jgi:hypothetical protein
MTSGIRRPTVSIVLAAAVPILSWMAASQETKLVRYAVGPKPLISITNEYGAITVRPSGNNQIVVSTVSYSNAISFVSEQHGNRVELRAESNRRGTSLERNIPCWSRMIQSSPCDHSTEVCASKGCKGM